MAAYEARQPVQRGMGVDWAHHDSTNDVVALSTIYSRVPSILTGVSEDSVPTIQFAAAMRYLFGEKKRRWIAIDFPTGLDQFNADSAAYMFWRAGMMAIHVHNASGPFYRAKRATIVTLPDSCFSCRRIGQQVFDFASLPELPHPSCSTPGGCRCLFRFEV